MYRSISTTTTSLCLYTGCPLFAPAQVSPLLALADHQPFRLWITHTVWDEQKSTCEEMEGQEGRKRGKWKIGRNERERMGPVHQGISLQLVRREVVGMRMEGGGRWIWRLKVGLASLKFNVSGLWKQQRDYDKKPFSHLNMRTLSICRSSIHILMYLTII